MFESQELSLCRCRRRGKEIIKDIEGSVSRLGGYFEETCRNVYARCGESYGSRIEIPGQGEVESNGEGGMLGSGVIVGGDSVREGP